MKIRHEEQSSLDWKAILIRCSHESLLQNSEFAQHFEAKGAKKKKKALYSALFLMCEKKNEVKDERSLQDME